MKKYKLIRTYPGSPTPIGLIYSAISGMSLYKHPTKDNQCIKSEHIENIPEFWQEIVEKDYEILTIECKWSSPRRSPGDIIKNQPGNGCESYNEHCHLIHSVKRLSDGEVFTIGNEIIVSGFNLKCEIKQFNILNNIMYCGEIRIDAIQHIKKPLFTTEDGVDIFAGDKTCWINNWTVTNFIDWKGYDGTTNKHFSTIESAKEYILMNKPCLSIEDVMGVAYNPQESRTSSSRKLKKIVQEKINVNK